VLDDRLTPAVEDLPLDSTPQDVLDTLLEGLPRYAEGTVLRTALPEQLTATVLVSRGLAVVDTDTSLLTEISPVDQRFAIGQIVLTLTSRPGIGQVSFTVDGRPQAVPRGRGDLAPANEPVAYDDYVSLLDDAPTQ
jgi:spore germination protein GerM